MNGKNLGKAVVVGGQSQANKINKSQVCRCWGGKSCGCMGYGNKEGMVTFKLQGQVTAGASHKEPSSVRSGN